MTVTSVVTINVNFSGDVSYAQDFQTPVASTTSPGAIENKALTTGNNTVTPPTGATGCTIVPSPANTDAITIKGVNGDTGIPISETNPTHLTLASAAAFVINVAADMTLRLVWS